MTAGNARPANRESRDEGYPMTLHLRLQPPRNAIENRRRGGTGTDHSPCVVAQDEPRAKAPVVGGGHHIDQNLAVIPLILPQKSLYISVGT